MEHFFSKLKELKFAPAESGIMEFSGYGAVFSNEDSYGDVIEPGAFSKFLTDVKTGVQNWPAMLLQHGGIDLTAESMTPIGAWTHLSEDNHGLKVTGQLAETQRGKEVYTLMKMQPRAGIDGLSIGYVAREFVNGVKSGDPKRRLKRIDLVEVSPVTWPANGKARVSSIKSLDDLTERDFEALLCNGGYSKKAAKTIISSGFRALQLQKDNDPYDLTELKAAIDSGINLLTRH